MMSYLTKQDGCDITTSNGSNVSNRGMNNLK